MKQTLSLTPSTAPLGLDAWFANSAVVITGTVPAYPTMGVWAMQLWESQWELLDDPTAEPIATAIGSVVSGVLTITFTPTQMTLTGLSAVAGSNNHWLTIGGQDTDGNQQIIRGGNIEINPCPWAAANIANSIGITVTDDMATFIYDGATYTFPVALIASPPVTPTGVAVDDDSVYIDFGGDVFGAPVAEVDPAPPEAVEGELIVIDDNLIITLSGVSYTIPVQQL